MTRFATHFDLIHSLDLKTLRSYATTRCDASEPLEWHLLQQSDRDPDGVGLTPCIEASESIQAFHLETHYVNIGHTAETITFEAKGRRMRLTAFNDGSAAIEWVRKNDDTFYLIPWIFTLPDSFRINEHVIQIDQSFTIPEISYDFKRKDQHGAAARGTTHLFAPTPGEHEGVAPLRNAFLAALRDEITKLIDVFQGALPIARGRDRLELAQVGLAALPPFIDQWAGEDDLLADRLIKDIAIWLGINVPDWGKGAITLMGRKIDADGSVGPTSVILMTQGSIRLRGIEARLQEALDSDTPPIPLVAQVRRIEYLNMPLGGAFSDRYDPAPSSHEKLAALHRIDQILEGCTLLPDLA
jgi:hypothetical protein